MVNLLLLIVAAVVLAFLYARVRAWDDEQARAANEAGEAVGDDEDARAA